MHPNEKLLHSFYGHLERLDPVGMCRCYQREIVYSDPIFGTLKSWEAAARWHMLCDSSKTIDVHLIDVQADEDGGEATWDITYTFADTGRRVHTSIRTEVTFFQGKIIRHKDEFDLWDWARQAYGLRGRLLGWSHRFQRKLQKTARRRLRYYVKKKTSRA